MKGGGKDAEVAKYTKYTLKALFIRMLRRWPKRMVSLLHAITLNRIYRIVGATITTGVFAIGFTSLAFINNGAMYGIPELSLLFFEEAIKKAMNDMPDCPGIGDDLMKSLASPITPKNELKENLSILISTLGDQQNQKLAPGIVVCLSMLLICLYFWNRSRFDFIMLMLAKVVRSGKINISRLRGLIRLLKGAGVNVDIDMYIYTDVIDEAIDVFSE